jgi:hypothetical protein
LTAGASQQLNRKSIIRLPKPSRTYFNLLKGQIMTVEKNQHQTATAPKHFHMWVGAIISAVMLLTIGAVAVAKYYSEKKPSEAAIGIATSKPEPEDIWYNSEWQYRQLINIDETKVSIDLTDYPLLINSIRESWAGEACANGEDVIFTDTTGTLLPHEIERYVVEGTQASLTAWVKLDSTVAQDPDHRLYIYYGRVDADQQSLCDSQENPTAVWGTEYVMVHHMDINNGTFVDSTSHGYVGTIVGDVTQDVGKIGQAAQFDTDSDIGEYAEQLDSGIGPLSTEITVQGWVKAQAGDIQATMWSGLYKDPWNNKTNMISVGYRKAYHQHNDYHAHSISTDLYAGPPDGMTSEVWHYETLILKLTDPACNPDLNTCATTLSIYADGAIQGSINMPNGYSDLEIKDWRIAKTSSFDQLMGMIDELRVAKTIRSDEWIQTDYNNQNSPETFYAIGEEEASVYNLTVYITNVNNGSGTVTINPGAITCTESCNNLLPAGVTYTLTAVASDYSEFNSWSGICTGTGTCTVTLDNAKDVTATFELPTYTITVTKQGGGTGTVIDDKDPHQISCGGYCVGDYDNGTPVTLTATPDAGSLFDGWSGGGCSGTGTCQITVGEDTVVIATFLPPPDPTFHLDIIKEGTGTGIVFDLPDGTTIECGDVCSADLTAGTVIELQAPADDGSKFVDWGDYRCNWVGLVPSCLVTMDQDVELHVSFDLDKKPSVD